jgi:hypothetical protein
MTVGESIDAACRSCGTCGKTVRAGAVLYTVDARPVCPLCYTKADVAAQSREVFDGWSTALIGAIANVIPLAVHAAATLMVAAGGVAASVGDHDWIELGSGVVAVLCGGATIAAARSRVSGGWLAVGVLVALLGVYHAVRGAGLAW